MKLHSPQFEKALKRKVHEAVRASPQLRRESRAGRRARWYNSTPFGRIGIAFGFGMVLWLVARRAQSASALAVIGLWSFFFIFMHAHRLLTTLYASRDLAALSLLPIPGTTIFRWELQKFCRWSLMSLLDVLAAYTALAIFYQLPAWNCAALVPIALLTWLVPLSLAILGAAYLPRFPYPLVNSVFLLGCGILFVGRSWIREWVLAQLEQAAPAINFLLPTGWSPTLFQLLLSNRSWTMLVLLAPIAAVLTTLKLSLRRLPKDYEFKEMLSHEPADLIPGHTETIDETAGATPETPSNLGPAAIEEIVRTRAFLQPPVWPRCGWFEALLWRWLTPREKTLSEFVFPNGFFIGAHWETIARVFLIALSLGFVVGLISNTAKFWVLVIGVLVACCQVLTQIVGTGTAFELTHSSGVTMPRYALLPIGFRELGRLLFKCTIVQLPLVGFFTIAGSLLVPYVAGFPFPPVMEIVFGIKVALLLCESRFIFLAFAFSSGTNDTTGFKLRVPILLVVMVGGGLLFLLLAGASLFVPDQRAAWFLVILANVEAYCFFRIYGWLYHVCRFDLMKLPKPTSG